MGQKIIYPLLFICSVGSIPILYQLLLFFKPPIVYIVIICISSILALLFVKSSWRKTSFHKFPALIIAASALAAYSAYLIFITVIRYYNFESEVIDLSYYHIAVWQLSEFHIPRIWDIPSRLVWDDHFEPILLFFVPVYWIVKNSVVLFFLQAVIVISGVIPICLIAKEKFKDKFIGISLSFAYLFFSGLQMGYAYGFHPIVLFPPFFFWTYYFLEKKNIRLYFLLLLITLLIKEEVAFTAMVLGLYILLFKKQRKVALATIAIGVVWYVLCFNIIFPYFSNGRGFVHLGQYGELGADGMAGLVKNIFLKPQLFFSTLITPLDKIDTLLHSFGPFGFILFLVPQTWLFVIPALLEKLLSFDIARLNGFHYSAVVAGVTVIATIESLVYILKQKFLFLTACTNVRFWAIFIFFVAFMVNMFYGYRPFSFSSVNMQISLPDHVKSVYKLISLLPIDASVSAQYQIAPHVVRPYGKILPAPRLNEDSDYVLLDLNVPLVLTTIDNYKRYFDGLVGDKKYKLIYKNDNVLLFKKL